MDNFKKQLFIEKKDLSSVHLDNLRNFSFDSLYSLIQTIANKHFIDVNSSSSNGNKDILSLTENKELIYDEKELWDASSDEESQPEDKWKKRDIVNNKILMKKETNLNLVNLFNKNGNLQPNIFDFGKSGRVGLDNGVGKRFKYNENIKLDQEECSQINESTLNNMFTNILELNDLSINSTIKIKFFLKLYTQFYVFFSNTKYSSSKSNGSSQGNLNHKTIANFISNSEDFYGLATYWLNYIYLCSIEKSDSSQFNSHLCRLYTDVIIEVLNALENKLTKLLTIEPINESWYTFIKSIPVYTESIVEHLNWANQSIVHNKDKKEKKPFQLKVYSWVIPILYKQGVANTQQNNQSMQSVVSLQNMNLFDAVFNRLLDLTVFRDSKISVNASSFLIENFFPYDKSNTTNSSYGFSENSYYEKKISAFASKEFSEIKQLRTEDKAIIKSKLYLFFLLCAKKNSINRNFCKEIPIIYSASSINSTSDAARSVIETHLPFLKENIISTEEVIEVINKCDENCEKLVEIISNNFSIEKVEKVSIKNEIIGYIEKFQKFDLLYNIVNKFTFEDIVERIIPLIFLHYSIQSTNLDKPEKPDEKRYIEILKKINSITFQNHLLTYTNSTSNEATTTEEGLLIIIYYFSIQKSSQMNQMNQMNQLNHLNQGNLGYQQHNQNIDLLKIKRGLIKFYSFYKSSINNTATNELNEFTNFIDYIINTSLQVIGIQENYIWQSVIWLFFEFSTNNRDMKLVILGKFILFIILERLKSMLGESRDIFNKPNVVGEIVNFFSEMKSDSVGILKSLPDNLKNYVKEMDKKNNLRDI